MSTLLDPALQKTIEQDRALLTKTKVPIVTVSASFKEDLKQYYGLPQNDYLPDVVFSRAHYSMALGVAVAAWGDAADIDPKKAWIVDPTNYVSNKDWRSIKLTEFIGKTLARRPFLKKLKDFVDQFLRSKLPIIENITPPLLELTKNISQPVLSLHIAAGNVLHEHGRTVVQVITDPHVRDDYLIHADSPRMFYCVFDEKTKTDFLEKAALKAKDADPDRVIVTGPPIDPRIIAASTKKKAWRSGPINLVIATGGLGTNKPEIRTMLHQLLPELRKRDPKYRLLIHAATHDDICAMVTDLAKEYRVAVGDINDKKAKLRILYHPQIVDANEYLIQFGFPWADGFISKPSGDMAYDAVVAGCFLLTLREWGVWEQNIEQVFEQMNIAREAEPMYIAAQLEILMEAQGKNQSWIESAMHNALTVDPLFTSGAKNILKAYRTVAKSY